MQRLQVKAEEVLRETRRGKEFKCERCKRWRHFNLGHSEGNECIICWREIEREILAFVKAARWRLETSIVDYILRQEPTLHASRVETWLAELVEVEGSLHWFTRGPEEQIGTKAYCEEPLRYRFIPKKRRRPDEQRRQHRRDRHPRRLVSKAS